MNENGLFPAWNGLSLLLNSNDWCGRALLPLRAWRCPGLLSVILISLAEADVLPSCDVSDATAKVKLSVMSWAAQDSRHGTNLQGYWMTQPKNRSSNSKTTASACPAKQFAPTPTHPFGTAPQSLKNGWNPHGCWVSIVFSYTQLRFLGSVAAGGASHSFRSFGRFVLAAALR